MANKQFFDGSLLGQKLIIRNKSRENIKNRCLAVSKSAGTVFFLDYSAVVPVFRTSSEHEGNNSLESKKGARF